MKLTEENLVYTTHVSGSPVTRVIIGLHGWTGNEHSMKPVAIGSRIQGACWYLPRGPYSLEKENQFSWFTGNKEMGWNCDRSFVLISKLIARIQSSEGVEPGSIYMAGFSQGACIAMEAGLRLNVRLGGIIAIAGFIRHTTLIREEITPGGKRTPVLIMHGSEDTVVAPEASHEALQLLTGLGIKAVLKTYRSSHKIPITAYPLIRRFITGD